MKNLTKSFLQWWSHCWGTDWNIFRVLYCNTIKADLSYAASFILWPSVQRALPCVCSLHEEATELLERQPHCGHDPGGTGLHAGFPEPRAAAEETSSGAGPGGEGGSEESLPTEALPLPQNHWGAGLPAQPEDQHRHQLVPQLQVSSRRIQVALRLFSHFKSRKCLFKGHLQKHPTTVSLYYIYHKWTP